MCTGCSFDYFSSVGFIEEKSPRLARTKTGVLLLVHVGTMLGLWIKLCIVMWPFSSPGLTLNKSIYDLGIQMNPVMTAYDFDP